MKQVKPPEILIVSEDGEYRYLFNFFFCINNWWKALFFIVMFCFYLDTTVSGRGYMALYVYMHDLTSSEFYSSWMTVAFM